MFRKNNYIVCFITVFALICVSLSGCGKADDGSAAVTKSYKDFVAPQSSEEELYFSNGKFSIEWNDQSKQIFVKELSSGKIYSTTPSNAISEKVRVDKYGIPIKNNPQIESAISVNYYDAASLEEFTVYSKIGAVNNGNIYVEKINNGIRVIYDFTENSIIVPVEYTIFDDHFSISVNPLEIFDDGLNFVTGISVAPFICGVENDSSKDSYLFIPDGSGVLAFPKTIDDIGIVGSSVVYGGDRVINKFNLESYTEQCYMPVFGMKDDNKGLFAIIGSGAERASINWHIGSSNIRYSTVYPYFSIRGYDREASPIGGKAELTVFNKYITDEKISVNYYTIDGEDCGYNDMVNIYRNYLSDNYGLKESKLTEQTLALEIEGGMECKRFFCGIPYTGFTKLTAVSEAQEITKYFSKLTDNLLVRLCGYTESGLDAGKVAGGFKINSKLGNKKQISNLTSFCKTNKITLSLDFDPISYNKNGNGYSIKNSSAKFSDFQNHFISSYNNVTRNYGKSKFFLISRSLIPDVVSKIIKKTSTYGFEAVGLGRLGSIIYSDYGNKESYVCDNIQEDVMAMLEGVSNSGASVVLTGANDYAACASDYITNAPVSSSKYDVETYSIPFYSMVFKGYVNMSSGAVNLSDNSDKMLLSCVEAGISPLYTVINNFTEETVTSEYISTRSSKYEYIKESIEECISKTKDFYKAVRGTKIIHHTVLNENLREIRYDNGVTVYINYGDSSQTVAGIEVPAKNYTIIGGKAE